ncbi:hypothetical protein D3C74_375410 [compost metagenome]
MRVHKRRKGTTQSVVLIILAVIAPIVLMSQRRGRGYFIHDTTIAVELFGALALVAALGIAITVRRGGPLFGERAAFVLLGVFTAVGAVLGGWRTFDEGPTVLTVLGVLAGLVAVGVYAMLAIRALPRPE